MPTTIQHTPSLFWSNRRRVKWNSRILDVHRAIFSYHTEMGVDDREIGNHSINSKSANILFYQPNNKITPKIVLFTQKKRSENISVEKNKKT